MQRHNRKAGITLINMLIAVAIIAIIMAGTVKAVTVTRALTARSQSLTKLMLRAHAEIEIRKSWPFERLKVGRTFLKGFDDSRTTGSVTLTRLPDSGAIRISVELVGRTHRGVERVRLSARRYPEIKPDLPPRKPPSGRRIIAY